MLSWERCSGRGGLQVQQPQQPGHMEENSRGVNLREGVVRRMGRIGAKGLGRDFALTSEIWVQSNQTVVDADGKRAVTAGLFGCPVRGIAPVLRVSGLGFISDHWLFCLCILASF